MAFMPLLVSFFYTIVSLAEFSLLELGLRSSEKTQSRLLLTKANESCPLNELLCLNTDD